MQQLTVKQITSATGVIYGRLTAAAGPGEELTGTQATTLLDIFTLTTKGVVPAPTEAVGAYMRDDGTWANPTPVVRCASTANFANSTPTATVLTASATGVTTIDGVNLALNDRVLLKNQTNAQENGVYKVTTAGAVGVAAILTRSLDLNTWAEISYSPEINVQTGTVNADTVWVSTADAGGTLGTTAINFKKILTSTDIVLGFGLGIAGTSANAARYPAKAPYDFTVSQSNSSGVALVAATASTVYTLKKGTVASSTTIGTFTFGIGGTVATVSISAGAINAGDTVWMEGPATADATLADIAFLIRG